MIALGLREGERQPCGSAALAHELCSDRKQAGYPEGQCDATIRQRKIHVGVGMSAG